MNRAVAGVMVWSLAAGVSGLAASACLRAPRHPPPPPLEPPPPLPPPPPAPPPPPPPPLPPPDAVDIGCDEGDTASPDLFLSMLPQCGDRVNVVAIGDSRPSAAGASFTRKFARRMRDRTATNLLNLAAPDELAGVLSKSRGRVTFLLVSGGGDAESSGVSNPSPVNAGANGTKSDADGELQRMETTFRGILDVRDTHSPNTVVVTRLDPKFNEFIVRLTSGTQALERRVIVVPEADETPDRVVDTIAARCGDLLTDGTGGARRCQLRP